MKRRHGKSLSMIESSETGEEVTTIEFTEVNFSLNFIINLLYRQVILEKFVFNVSLRVDIFIYSTIINT